MDDATSEPDLRILETDLDDASPETLGPLHERLRDVGAHHVSVLPTTTKGSRPGHLIRAIVPPGATDAVARVLARETGTLGVRAVPAEHAFVAETDRRYVVLQLDGSDHEVPVKVAWMEDDVYDVSADQATSASIAQAASLTQRDVATQAEAVLRDETSGYLAHVIHSESWEERDPTEDYEPDSVGEEGFVHCAPPGRISDVAAEMFDSESELRALIIDPRRLSSRIRYEPAGDTHYPHIYGPVDRDAIVESRVL